MRLSVFWLSVMPFCAFANMRAPIHMDFGAYTALMNEDKAASASVVGAESLHVNCRLLDDAFSNGDCRVQAVYKIQTKKKSTVKLRFLVPQPYDKFFGRGEQSRSPVLEKISVDGRELPFEQDHVSAKDTRGRGHTRVRFQTVLQGENIIGVVYRQPLSVEEVDGPSYFHKSKFINYFDYALWPLKEWKLAPDFSMHIELSLNRGKRGLLFWRRRVIQCRACAYDKTKDMPARCEVLGRDTTQKSGTIVFTRRFDRRFPDYLRCVMGRSNVVR